MKIAVGFALLAVAVSIAGGYYYKAKREEAKAEIAKECIDNGGRYRETIFRHRPVCKAQSGRF
jgi:hypothetical protein